MRIAVIGGGPGGLYTAALLKRLDPAREIAVFERNAPDDTFGFGVVLSDETAGGIEQADPVVYAALKDEFVRWDDIEIVHRGHTMVSGGHGFSALSRRRLLAVLHERCRDLGVELRFRTTAPRAAELAREYDLVVAADGVHSATREAHADAFGPHLTTHRCRYIWLAADFALDAFRFEIAETGHGVMQLHAYPFSGSESTVIVEMREEVWQAAGLDRMDENASAAYCAKLFPETLGGRPLRGNNSQWIPFRTVVNDSWSHGNTVLLGDAAHTAHFSIGSGTKLAVEDALALAACLQEQPTLTDALTAYEAERRPVVTSTQRAARASLEWFEDLATYADQPPHQFAFNLLTRSRRVTHDNLRLRDTAFVRAVEGEAGMPEGTPPMFTPFELGTTAAAQPGRRLRDGHVLGRGRPARRLPSRSPRRARPGWCRPGDDRDGVRLAGGPHHARLHRAVERRTGGGLAPSHRLRGRAGSRNRDRCPARALRAQGLHPADVGGHRRAAAGRQLAARGPLPAALPGRQPGAAGTQP